MKKKGSNFARIRYLLLIFVLILGGHYFYQKSHELKQLLNLTLLQVCVASLVVLLYLFILGWKYKVIINAFQIKLSIKEWFGLPQVVMLFNLLFFKSGTILNAHYLKKHRQLSYSKFIVGMSAQKLLNLFAVACTGFIFSGVFFVFQKADFYIVLFFFFMLVALLVLFFIPSNKMPRFKYGILEKIAKVVELWDDYKQNRSVIVEVIILEIASILILGLRYYVAFKILNSPISIPECLAISIIVSIIGLVSIIPGNIGIRETIVGISSYYMNYSFDYAIIATTLDRVVTTAWVGILGFIFFHLLHLKEYPKDAETISNAN